MNFSKTLNTSLGNKGYSVLKSDITEKEQAWLKDALTVKPATMGAFVANANPLTFPIYRESSKKIYMPRYFGEKEMGLAKENKIPPGEDIQVEFRGSLRDVQKPVVESFLTHIQKHSSGGGGLLELPCAAGKCLGKDTPVLLFDGTIKLVQDIVVGDVLMGDDSTPRNVLSTTTGREPMYRVQKGGHRGKGYVVNESHILSVKTLLHPKTQDISVVDYLSLPSRDQRDLLGFHVPVFFSEKETEYDPYMFGFWLCHTSKWKNNDEIKEINENHAFLQKYGLEKNVAAGTDSEDDLSSKRSEVKRKSLEKKKYIPWHYKCNSREKRIQLLKGILLCYGQTNGVLYTVWERNTLLRQDVVYVARSLGYDVVILEDQIQIYCDPLCETPTKKIVYPFRLEPLGVDDYYGFEIDGNRRFVLGDFSVTHNTVISIHLITQIKKKTLVIVNKEFLMNQWIERIRDFAPTARIGKIQGSVVDIENKDVVIGMLQSLSMKDYPSETFASFGLTIFDEVHHISSEVFSAALFKIVTPYMLGLSATMERKDGTTYVFKLFLGDIVYKGTTDEQHAVCVRAIEYITPDALFNEVETDYRGNPQYSKMIVKLCDYGPRSDFIVRVVKDLIAENPPNQIMIIAHNRSILTYLFEALSHQRVATIGYYVGGMKQTALDESSTRQIILCTYSMAAEALDIKTLSTMVMVTPKTDIVQCIGRILRVKHSQPIVVDIVDKHDLFQNQWAKRRTYFKKCNYRIRMTDSQTYTNMLEMDRWKTVFEPKNQTNLGSKKTDCTQRVCWIDTNLFT